MELLEEYTRLLLRWNERINLISRRDEGNIWLRHILHCVSLLFNLSIQEDAKVLDLGTGGGLPGIPIKIFIPTLSLVLVDSIKKKAEAVADIVLQLGLADVKVKCARAEKLATEEGFKNAFDYVLARSVADLKRLVQWSFPLLKSRSPDMTLETHTQQKPFIRSPALVAMKGGDLGAEIALARKSRHVREIEVIDLNIKGLNASHNPNRKAVVVHF
jgi:16S rRNA (guanine527-N7)-methyltransferase